MPTATDPIRPLFPTPQGAHMLTTPPESPSLTFLIKSLNLSPHPEGGYFVLTDVDPLRVPNPFPPTSSEDTTRLASTSIFYLLTPARPTGNFHRNKARTVHCLHQGRGRYVVIHPTEDRGKGRVETFVVGPNVEKGERLQWVVEGGKWKASFLLPDDGGGGSISEGLLISETVVPGFEWIDHDFMKPETLRDLVTDEQHEELEWLLRKDWKENGVILNGT